MDWLKSIRASFPCKSRHFWKRSIKGHAHRWRQIHVRHVSRLVLLFSCPENPSINHLNFYWIKQIDYIFPCVSQRVKNNSHATVATRLRLVSYFLLFTRCDICDLLQYTGMGKNVIYLLNNYFSNIVLYHIATTLHLAI